MYCTVYASRRMINCHEKIVAMRKKALSITENNIPQDDSQLYCLIARQWRLWLSVAFGQLSTESWSQNISELASAIPPNDDVQVIVPMLQNFVVEYRSGILQSESKSIDGASENAERQKRQSAENLRCFLLLILRTPNNERSGIAATVLQNLSKLFSRMFLLSEKLPLRAMALGKEIGLCHLHLAKLITGSQVCYLMVNGHHSQYPGVWM